MRDHLRNALLGLVLLLVPGLVSAQVGTVQGRVMESGTGLPVPGVNVTLEGTTLGTATDVDGNYAFSAPVGSYTLVASAIGYRRTTRPVTVRQGVTSTVNFEINTDVLGLEDVVVTGYGIETRREETASSVVVSGEKLRNLPVQTADAALQGRAAGVQITSATGAPGGGLQVRVRGVGSINAGNSPLYVIDGVPIGMAELSSQAQSNALNSLNPHDIESIEILKDAAAVSIYGAQASNGVVLITTRRGTRGTTQFNISSQIGLVEPIKTYDLLNGPEFVNAMIESYENYYETNGYTREQGRADAIADFGDPSQVNSYDWQDAVYRTGAMRQLNVSASGGGESTTFYLSGGINYQEGQIIKSDYSRLTFAANFDHRASKRLGLEARVRVARTEQFGTISDGNYVNGPFYGAPNMPPIDPIYNDDGTYNTDVTGGYNIVQGVNLEQREGRTNQFGGNLGANYQISSNFFLRAFGGADYRMVRDHNYRPREIPAFAGTGGSGFESAREILNYNANSTLSYLKTFGELHDVSAMVGGEIRQEQRELISASGQGFPNGLFSSLQNAAKPSGVGGYFTEYKTAGVFSQVKYDYDNKYFLTGSLRTDGSSRFGSDRRWGTFYSLSGAWDMAQERFFDFAPSVDQLQLRASYGVTGNSDIDNFAPRSLIGSGGSYVGEPAIRPSQLGNNLLTWEQAGTVNLGLDYAFFGSRISGAIDAYSRRNSRLLLDRPLPGDTGFDDITQNVGAVQNQGLEFELSTINVATRGFNWTTDFNISFQRNEVLELSDDQENLGSSIRVGQPLEVYWLPRYAGVNPADGRAMWYDKDGNITYTPKEGDQVVAGKIIPDYWGGMNNSFSYAGLRLDMFLQFSVGQSTFNQHQGYFLLDPSRYRNLERKILDRWQQPGDITDVPRLYPVANEPGSASTITASSRYIEDVSYLRLKNVQLSYTLPQQLTGRIGLRGLTVFVQGQNLVTWTPYSGIDPELVDTQAAVYPQGKQYTTGLQVQF